MNKIRFVTIGFVEQHKGQDILVSAIKKLNESLLNECEFLIVGNKSTLFAKDLQKKVIEIPCVTMTGTVNRNDLHELLSKSDVLICPSREDSMPTVCAEAMMHSVPCLVSDSTGTARYIKDGYDGIIFESENSMELANKIAWCIANRKEIKIMGEKAYCIYKSFFSMYVFEKNLLRCVQEMIKCKEESKND